MERVIRPMVPVNPEGVDEIAQQLLDEQPSQGTERVMPPLFRYSGAPLTGIPTGAQSTSANWFSAVAFPGSTSPEQGTFFTLDRYSDGLEVQKFLALVYKPRFWASYVPGGEESLKSISFRNAWGETNQVNRTWPAFGRTGAGSETILIKGLLARVREGELRLAGGPTAWRMVRTLSGPLSVPIGVFGTLSATLRRAFGMIREEFGGKDERAGPFIRIETVGDRPEASMLKAQLTFKASRNYTMSIAQVESPAVEERVVTRFWEYGWEDDETAGTRYLWGPVQAWGRFYSRQRKAGSVPADEERRLAKKLVMLHRRLLNAFRTGIQSSTSRLPVLPALPSWFRQCGT